MAGNYKQKVTEYLKERIGKKIDPQAMLEELFGETSKPLKRTFDPILEEAKEREGEYIECGESKTLVLCIKYLGSPNRRGRLYLWECPVCGSGRFEGFFSDVKRASKRLACVSCIQKELKKKQGQMQKIKKAKGRMTSAGTLLEIKDKGPGWKKYSEEEEKRIMEELKRRQNV